MSRRRRAVLLLGLALSLGGLAASDVSRREAAIRRQLGPPVEAMVARGELSAGTRLSPRNTAIRRVPARYAPVAAFSAPEEVVGLRAAVRVPAGAFLSPGQVDDGGPAADGPRLRPGERVADVIALGSPSLVAPGSRVDVLVTRESSAGTGGRTSLALEDVEVLGAAPAGRDAAGDGPDAGQPRVAASLRVTLRQAVYLAAAQAFSREIRLLPRARADRHRGHAGLAVGSGL
jgi:pilus assembly protein CpaB